MSQDQHTTEQGPGKPLSASVAASDPGVGASRRPDPENGAQAGAESFELRQRLADAVDDAWRKSLETHAFGPRARAEITDAVLAVVQPELDRLDRIRDAARLHRQQLISTSELYAVIEAMDATAATEPATITDPAWLREQYVGAMLDVIEPFRALVKPEAIRITDELAAAVMGVRDRHLDQLRQRLQLADALRTLDGQPPAPDAGPTVREAAADDRLWPLQKHGE